MKESYLNDLVMPLQQTCWDFLFKMFGGGPEVTTLQVCPVCEVCDLKLQKRSFQKSTQHLSIYDFFLQKELEELEKRRTYEFDTLKEIFDNSDSSAPQYFISIKWFKEWKNFVDGVNKGNVAFLPYNAPSYLSHSPTS